jgi:hypothetical protein
MIFWAFIASGVIFIFWGIYYFASKDKYRRPGEWF